jgi:hypothetical protein
VQKKLGAMFKLEGPRLQRLFSGQPMPIKKGIDMDQAVKYRVAFRDAGALVDIRPAAAPQHNPTADPEPAMETDGQTPLTLSPAKGFDLSDCKVSLAPQAIPDITNLVLEDPGVILDEQPPQEPLEIDTESLELDNPGVTLDPAEPQPPVEIDTDDLQLQPANQGSLEEFQQQAEQLPLPNIDHLEFTEPGTQTKARAESKTSED